LRDLLGLTVPLWFQHLLILIAVAGCAAYLLRGVVRAMQGRKSRIGGCGVCTGCATTELAPKPKSERIVMVPIDAMIRSSKSRSAKQSSR
jgi:hypothetical protein